MIWLLETVYLCPGFMSFAHFLLFLKKYIKRGTLRLNFFSCLSRDRNTLQYVNLIVTSQIFRKFSGMQNVQSRGLPQDEGKEKVGQRRQERECKVQKEDIATNQSIDSF